MDPCTGPVRVPEHARRLITAHLVYRRLQGAGDTDPFFVNDHESGQSPAVLLHRRTSTTCLQLNLRPTWLHNGECSYGADVGLGRRTFGWLNERGLSLHQLDPQLAAPERQRRPTVTS